MFSEEIEKPGEDAIEISWFDQWFDKLLDQMSLGILSEHLVWIKLFLWIFVGYLGAKLIIFIINRVIKHGASKTKNQFDDLLVEKLKTPVFWSVFLFACNSGLKRLLSENWAERLESATLSFLVLFWLIFAVSMMRYLLRSSAHSNKGPRFIQKRTLPLFENFLVILSYVIGIYFILVLWNINVGPIVASAGIMGLAMSLAAKDTMANLFAGIFIMADAPYKIGDYIVLDSGERGKVTHIGIRSTRILTRDDVEVTVPNAIMGNSKIINETAGPHEKYRIRIQVGLAYGSSVEKIRDVLLSVTKNNKDICINPEPRVRFRTFGDSGLNFELLCWVEEPELRGKVSDLLNEQVYNALNQAGIEIPYPKQDVYVRHIEPK